MSEFRLTIIFWIDGDFDKIMVTLRFCSKKKVSVVHVLVHLLLFDPM